MNNITLEDIKNNPHIKAYIEKADEQMESIGYTEHGFRHATFVSNTAKNIMQSLGFDSREIELAQIAGYLHDIGNVVSRSYHGQTGALIAFQILTEMKMDSGDVAEIMGAIGNHDDEEYGDVATKISAAIVLADKSDVHKSRVRNPNTLSFDIHDRTNYAAEESLLEVNKEKKTITLKIKINTDIAPVMEYFETFLQRMIMSRRAAKILGCEFKLEINGVKFL